MKEQLQPISKTLQRGLQSEDSQVWQRIETFTDSDGNTIQITNIAYMELASGMHYREDGEWKESQDLIESYPTGAIARHGRHKVIFADNLASDVVVDLQMPDGKRLQSRVLGLFYFDAESGKSVLLAEATNSAGRIVQSNQVVYADAFAGMNADVRYTYRKSGLEQDIILREQPKSPESYGLNPQTTKLQAVTEFLSPPTPEQRPLKTKTIDDVTLDFGSMRMILGKAFDVDAENDPAKKVPVGKRWQTVDGRTVLIEEVALPKIQKQLSTLPEHRRTSSFWKRNKNRNVATAGLKLPAKKTVALAPRAMQMASVTAPSRGLVLDYVIVGSSVTDYTFKGDTTYLISDEIYAGGVTTIEGGAVIKYLPNTYASIRADYFDFKTGPYRMAIFTSRDDNSVGEIISGSTGNPTTTSLMYLYSLGGAPLRYCNIRYAGIGTFDDNTTDVWHSQFASCDTAVYSIYPNLYNVLFNNCNAAVYDGDGWGGEPRRIEHVTANNCNWFWIGGSTFNTYTVNNCIFTAVTTLFDSGIQPSVSPLPLVNLPNSIGVFRTGTGAGHHYLVTSTQYEDIGTTAINSTLLEDLKLKTVFAPHAANILDNTTIANGTTWSPSVQRDADNQPDLGYHYDPLDYCVSRLTLGGTLNVQPGTAIGFYGTYGFQYGTLNIQGTPLNRSKIAHYSAVQEQSAAWGANASASYLLKNGSMPTTTATFTDISTAGGPTFAGGSLKPLNLTHSSLYGAKMVFDGGGPGNQTFTNNIIQRSSLTYGMCYGAGYGIRLVNNLYLDSNLGVGHFCYSGLVGSLSIRNNLFARSTFTHGYSPSQYPVITHNGFHNSYVTQQGSSAKTIASLDFQTGALGSYYYPTTGGNLSQLIDAGSGLAAQSGFFHYTTSTSQQKDGFSTVDIGMHYVALNGNLPTSQPTDADGDFVADYAEDANGNGIVDSPTEQTTPWFNSSGLWTTPFAMGVLRNVQNGQELFGGQSIHATVLPTGKVAYFPSSSFFQEFDPVTQVTSDITLPSFNTFCTGHTLMQDGSLFLAGGHWQTPAGLRTMATYSPLDDFWTRLPIMTTPRWYPSCITLDSGEILITGGTYGTGNPEMMIDDNDLPQVWNPTTGQFRNLTSALKKVRFYPYMFQHPAGGVFYAGPELLEETGDDRLKTLKLSTTTPGSWTDLGQLAEHREHSAPVMYEPGKILVAGGCGHWNSGLPEKSAELIDLTQTTPAWTVAQPMEYERIHHNGTILPDGTVLVTGGHRDQTATLDGYDPYPANGDRKAFYGATEVSVRTPELWGPDPLIPTQPSTQWPWTKLAECPSYRGYHSTALLLPDGRVLSAGGNFSYPYNVSGAIWDGELFSPPYLFKGSRPVINEAPKVVGYGETFTVKTPSTDTVQKVTLVRLGSVTHSFNANQRFLKPSFVRGTTTGGITSWQVTAPPNAQVCPPGHYMLFVINNVGVPSVASIIQILPASAPPIVMVCPANAGFVSPGAIKVSAALKNADAGVSLEFRKQTGSTWLQIGSTVPYSQAMDGGRHYATTWSETVQAQYTIKAVAIKAGNTIFESAPFTVTVRELPTWDTISFDPPQGGTTFAENSQTPGSGNKEHYAVPVQVSVQGSRSGSSSGSVSLMELYANRSVEAARAGILAASRTSPPSFADDTDPHQYTWPFAQSGNNQIAPLVRDELGVEQAFGGSTIKVFGGALDTTFAASAPNGSVRAMAVQSDGKILIGGDFTTVGGQSRNRIARLNSDLDVLTQDGSLDTSFTPGSGADGTVNTIAVQTVSGQDKVIIGGTFTSVDGTTRNKIARLNSNGTLDTTFNPNVGGGDVHSIVVQPDGKIIIGGAFTTVVGGQPTAQTRNRIAKLNSDGSLDMGFNPNITTTIIGSSPVVYSIALKLSPIGALENILVGGDFTTVGTQTRNRLARLDANGNLDSSFNPSSPLNNSIKTVAVQADGKVVIGGEFTAVIPTFNKNYVARLNGNGGLDNDFGTSSLIGGTTPVVYSVVVQPNGQILVGGKFTSANGNNLARLNGNNGSLDNNFRPSPTTQVSQHGADNTIRTLAMDSYGLLLLGGEFGTYKVPGQDSQNNPQPLSRGPHVARVGGL